MIDYFVRTQRTALPSGRGRIRTFEGIRQQIYSLSPLATWVLALSVVSGHCKRERRGDQGGTGDKHRGVSVWQLHELNHALTGALRNRRMLSGEAGAASSGFCSPTAAP